MTRESLALLAGGLVLSAVLVSCSSSSPGTGDPDQGPGAKVLDARERISRARLLLEDGRAEDALAQLDLVFPAADALDEQERYELGLLAGRANLAFAQSAIREGRSGGLIEGSYADAERRLEEAASLRRAEPEPWVWLARLRFQAGSWDGMEEAAVQARELFTARLSAADKDEDGEIKAEAQLSPEARRDLGTVLRLEGYAWLRRTIDEVQAAREEDPEAKVPPEAMDNASRALARLKKSIEIQPAQSDAYTWMANAYEWVGRPTEAIAALELAIRRVPRSDANHTRLQDLYTRYGRSRELVALYNDLVEAPALAADRDYLEWYRGQALLRAADIRRQAGDREGAEEAYDKASAAYAASAAANPDFTQNASLSRAICDLSKAVMALEDGEEQVAERLLDHAYETSPGIAAEDADGAPLVHDSFRRSYAGTANALGSRFGPRRLEDAVRYWRKLAARHEGWGWVWNNLGFALRDYGSQVARAGEGGRDQAMQLWEESYQAYRKAVEHSPEDERIVNDCGLMLVYHLEREPEEAERLFRKAIALGDNRLADMDPDEAGIAANLRTPRRDVEEAVGDAWQNLGVLFEKLGRLEEAVAAFEKATAYWSPDLRARVKGTIQRLQGRLEAEKQGDPAGDGASKGEDGSKGGGTLENRIPPGPTIAHVAPELPGDGDEIDEAIALLDRGEAEKALGIVEPSLRKRPDDVELVYLAGLGSLRFAEQAMAARRRGADSNLIDAVERLTRADRLTRDLDGGSAHLGNAIHVLPALFLMQALIQQGKGELARSAGNTHRTHLMGVPLKQDPGLMLRFDATLGEACLRAAAQVSAEDGEEDVDARRAERLEEARRALTTAHKALAELAGDGRADLASLRKQAGIDFDPARIYTDWRDVELWQGKPAGAVVAMAKGAALLPADQGQALIARMLETAQERGQGAIAVRELERLQDGDATMRWFLARARFLQALDERKERHPEPALAAIRASRADFEKAVADSPGFAAGTRIWLAYTWLAEGALAFDDKQITEAGDAMIKALEATTEAAGATDFSGWTTKTYLEAIGGRHYQAGTLDQGIALLDRALKLLPADPGLLNNKAFLLRELGTRKARGAPDEARKLFEASWATYKQAVTHSPEDVRLLNDTALIDVHYLHVDKQGSRTMLERAIELGDAQKADRVDATDDERKVLDEAIGDACMNLGKLLFEQFGDLAAARKALEKSKSYWRPSHADVRALLNRIERKEADGGKDGPADGGGGR